MRSRALGPSCFCFVCLYVVASYMFKNVCSFFSGQIGNILKKMPTLRDIFYTHGLLCASHPLEVLVTTVTIIMSVMSIGKATDCSGYGCGWNYLCAKKQVSCRNFPTLWLELPLCQETSSRDFPTLWLVLPLCQETSKLQGFSYLVVGTTSVPRNR